MNLWPSIDFGTGKNCCGHNLSRDSLSHQLTQTKLDQAFTGAICTMLRLLLERGINLQICDIPMPLIPHAKTSSLTDTVG